MRNINTKKYRNISVSPFTDYTNKSTDFFFSLSITCSVSSKFNVLQHIKEFFSFYMQSGTSFALSVLSNLQQSTIFNIQNAHSRFEIPFVSTLMGDKILKATRAFSFGIIMLSEHQTPCMYITEDYATLSDRFDSENQSAGKLSFRQIERCQHFNINRSLVREYSCNNPWYEFWMRFHYMHSSYCEIKYSWINNCISNIFGRAELIRGSIFN